MNKFTLAEVAAHEARVAAGRRVLPPLITAVSMLAKADKREARLKAAGWCANERDLHDLILADCKRRGWRVVHSAMHCATTNGNGVADFIIYADRGRVFTIEAKARLGKLTMEQAGFIRQLESLGHKCAVVRSFNEYLEAVS